MKTLKFALPLLAVTVLSGCGSETFVKPVSEKDLEDAQLLIIEPTEKSVFNTQTHEDLVRNIYNIDRTYGVILDKEEKNQRPDLIAKIESRIAYIEDLNLGKDAEKVILNDLNTLLTYHQNWLKFENELTDKMLWDAYSSEYPKVAPEVMRGAKLKAQYEAYIEPFENSFNQAREAKKQADITLKAESEKIKDKMLEYVIDNSIAITREKLSIYTVTKTFNMIDGKCPIESYYTDIPMQTILNKATNKCEYVMPISNTTRGVSEEHQEGLSKVVTSLNKGMTEAWVAREEAEGFIKLASRKLRDEKIIADNKFDGITGYGWIKKAHKLSSLSDGYFNATTFSWGSFGGKGFGAAATLVAKHQNIDLSAPDYHDILNERTVFLAYNSLLNKELSEAIVIDDIDSDGGTNLDKDQYLDAIKILKVSQGSGSKTYYLLEETKGEDDLRVLKAMGFMTTLEEFPIYNSKADWQSLNVLKNGINFCSHGGENKCLTK